ncbi:MAG: site-2 protease family protein [Patescibacteria group bacterium]|nr:site-2 protease family protein [Patescibacteria group bacterium]
MNLTTLFSDPILFVLWIVAVLVALTVHEFSHALAATWLGDPTAKRMGRLSLNPLAHIDWFGLLALVLVSFGWGKPVPFNPYLLRDQKWGPLYIGLAGPFSNLLMLSLVGLLLRILLPILGPNNLLIVFLGLCFLINTALMLFNLIPLPPLDGSKIIMALLHKPKWFAFREKLERYGSWILMGLILLDVVFGIGLISAVLGGPYHWVAGLFGLNGLFGL